MRKVETERGEVGGRKGGGEVRERERDFFEWEGESRLVSE